MKKNNIVMGQRFRNVQKLKLQGDDEALAMIYLNKGRSRKEHPDNIAACALLVNSRTMYRTLRAMLNCPGIGDTDQDSGETYHALVVAVLDKVDADALALMNPK